jgi:TM2 domain-containing membrane protein YozV
MQKSDRSWTVTILLAIFLGLFGAHRFYAGKYLTGALWLFTAGMFGIGWVIDILLILTSTFLDKDGYTIKP